MAVEIIVKSIEDAKKEGIDLSKQYESILCLLLEIHALNMKCVEIAMSLQKDFGLKLPEIQDLEGTIEKYKALIERDAAGQTEPENMN